MLHELKEAMDDLVKDKNSVGQHFWDLEVDIMNDFRYYFPSKNPHFLQKISLKKKKQRIKKQSSSLLGMAKKCLSCNWLSKAN